MISFKELLSEVAIVKTSGKVAFKDKPSADDKLYAVMVKAHIAEIKRVFGKNAQYNLGFSGSDEEISSSIKAQGSKNGEGGILTTYFDPKTYKVIRHETEED